MTRLKMSRPKLSVPSECAAPIPVGAFIIAVSSCLFGSNGAMLGPMMPMMINNKTITPPVNALTWSRGRRRGQTTLFSVADSRVNDCIKTIYDQIDRDEGECVGHHDSSDQRVITGIQRGNQQTAASRPGENGLDNNGAAEERPQLESDHGDHRNQGVARDMAPYDIFFL